MQKLNKSINSSTVNFLRKEVDVIYNSDLIKLSELVTLLAHIGYEPLINLESAEQVPSKKTNKSRIIKIGVAGFCFGNIMMLSFPEYFSLGNFQDQTQLKTLFGYVNLLLSLPVFFYSASEFFISAWNSLKYRYLNIDTPIALAVLVTFVRSLYEIISATGAGYMDSMTGIVFFMLIGRYFQDKTYETLSFERDYKSYFPLGVTTKDKSGKEKNIPVAELKKGSRVIIRNGELIPADAILMSTTTHVDYSFITGESVPVKKKAGELVYAGAKQLDGAIELEIVKPTSQSYLTQLWNKENGDQQKNSRSYVDSINKYFTIGVLLLSFGGAVYWSFYDISRAINVLTAVLIVACPCGLLLTATFANGNILRILGRNKFYLKNAEVIEKLAKSDTVVFDKTGTITHGATIKFLGPKLSENSLQLFVSLAAQSSHPLSRRIVDNYFGIKKLVVSDFQEYAGNGIKGIVNGKSVMLGSQYFISGIKSEEEQLSTKVFVRVDDEILGYFSFSNTFRSGTPQLIKDFTKNGFKLMLLSGDNDSERERVEQIFGKETQLFFNQSPEEKMQQIKALQKQNHLVCMVGDGLNDAGALQQSNVGIAVTDDTNNFSPACDAILDGSVLNKLSLFIEFAKTGKKVIVTTFIISFVYNIIGLSFAIRGMLSPVNAAILMPASSISIVVIATLLTTLIARLKKL